MQFTTKENTGIYSPLCDNNIYVVKTISLKKYIINKVFENRFIYLIHQQVNTKKYYRHCRNERKNKNVWFEFGIVSRTCEGLFIIL